MQFNKVMFGGNLTRDPVVTNLPSGTACCEIGIASNRRWKTRDTQEEREEVTFVDAVAFDRTAEVIGEHFQKGSPIFIEGRLKLEQWEAQDGSKRSKLRIIVENFRFVGKKEDGGAQPQNGGRSSAGHANPRQQSTQRAAAEGANRQQRGGKPPQRQQPQCDQYEDDTPPIKDDDIPF